MPDCVGDGSDCSGNAELADTFDAEWVDVGVVFVTLFEILYRRRAWGKALPDAIRFGVGVEPPGAVRRESP